MLKILSNIFKSQIQLYEFTRGNEKFYFSSGDRDFLFNGNIYKPVTIKSSSIKATQDKTKSNITVNTDKDNQIGEWFKKYTPGNVKLFIWRTSRTDPSNFEKIFNGTVMSCEFKKSEIVFTCEPLSALTAKSICRYTYQTQCNHTLYKGRCKLNVEDYSFYTTVAGIEKDGVTIQLKDRNGYAGGDLQNGFIQTTNNQNSMIISDSGSEIIKILSPLEDLKVGSKIRVAKGCTRTSDICKSRFNNFDNFFGFEFVPTRNIFEDGIKNTKE